MAKTQGKLFRFSTYLWLMLGLLVGSIASFVVYVHEEKDIDRANEARLQSTRLTEELRRSSDDLTRMARTYVVTDDIVYKKHHRAILDIRDGKKSRPVDNNNSYWDYPHVDEQQLPDSGPAVPLLDLMRRAGFTEQEFANLTEAKKDSDALTQIEFAAMALIESGVPPREVKRDKAIRMLHDAAYHQAKAKIMQSIDKSAHMVDQRSHQAVHAAESSALQMRMLLIALCLLQALLLWMTRQRLMAMLGCPAQELYGYIARLGGGDFSTAIHVRADRKDTVLGWLSETQSKLARLELRQFEAIVNFTDDAIISKTLDGVIKSWNPGAEKIFGYTAVEAIGNSMRLLIPAERQHEEPEILARIMRGERVEHFETVRRHKDGHLIDISATISPILDEAGNIIGASKIARVITDRKQAENSLRESEARFRQMFVGNTSALLLIDPVSGAIVDANAAAAGFYGYSRDRLLTMSIDQINTLAPEQIAAERKSAVTRGRDYFTFCHRLANGDIRTVEVHSTPINVGERALLFSIIHDITEHKRSEDHRRILSRAVEQSPVSIVITDKTGTIEYVNPRFEEVTGYTAAEAIGNNPRILKSGKTAPEIYKTLWKTISEGREWRGELCNRRKNGELFFESAAISGLKNEDGQVGHYIAVKEDITQRKHDEASMLMLSEITANAPEGVSMVNVSDGTFIYTNRRFNEMFGYGEGELTGKPAAVINASAETSPEETAAQIVSSLECTGRWSGELLNVKKDGKKFWTSANVSRLEHPEFGTAWISLQSDVTARKKAESDLRDLNEHLESRIEERTRELARAKDVAELATRAKSDFLANMSHEIRTPLNSVLGFAQAGHNESTGRKAQRYFDHILDSGELLLIVINDVLDFSKMEAGKLEIERLPFDLRYAIDRARTLIAPRARDKGLRWEVKCTADLPAGCRGDSLRLTQILVNLLSNAVKFTACGGIALQAGLEGDWLVFSVEDTGIGLDVEQQARLFIPFEQAGSSTTRHFGGTGLGLAISRRLAQLLGGEISVESSPDRGSTFTLRLPYLPAEPPERPIASAPRSGPRLAGISILVAEDNEVNRLVLAELLAPDKPGLTFVSNGRAAVERFSADPLAFDIVLMDIQMPEMDGYEAAQRILRVSPTVPIIGLTAHALAEEREKILAAGMVAHVTKPVDLDKLVATILTHMQPGRLTTATGAIAEDATTTRVPPTFTRMTSGHPPLSAAAISGESDPRLIDWAAFSAHYNERPDFEVKLLNLTLKSHANTAAELRSAAQANDLQRMAFLAHFTKGMAGCLCTMQLQQLANDAEQAARRNGDAATASALALATTIEGVLNEVRLRLSALARIS